MNTRNDAQLEVRRRTRNRWAAGLNTGVAILLAAAIGGMILYLSSRHYHRWDLSRTRYFSLSDKTRTLLKSLTNEVRVVVFLQPGTSLYTDVDLLLKEYQFASRRIRVTRVDPDRDIARAEELVRQYKVNEANVVVFDSNGRSKFVKSTDLVEMDFSGVQQGQRPRKVAFLGEEVFSSAIHDVAKGESPVVYFLAGHGEKSPDGYERAIGLSDLARQVRRDNIEIKTLRLGESHRIPEDARALVVAGPKQRLPQAELDVLASYLDRNGRAVFLLDSGVDTGLESLLLAWDIQAGNDRVVDGNRTISGRELFVSRYGPHPVTEKMQNLDSIFYLPRSISAAAPAGGANGNAKADRPRVTELAFCSDSGWGETDLSQKVMRFDPGVDRPGPVPVAAAAEKGEVRGVEAGITPTRLVVFGDSTFVANGAMAAGNANLIMAALNWVLDRREMMGIAPRPVEGLRMDLTGRQYVWLGWTVVVFLPAAVALLGLAVWIRRRR